MEHIRITSYNVCYTKLLRLLALFPKIIDRNSKQGEGSVVSHCPGTRGFEFCTEIFFVKEFGFMVIYGMFFHLLVDIGSYKVDDEQRDHHQNSKVPIEHIDEMVLFQIHHILNNSS